ncbi:MAG TPA: hypothetical protein VFB96_13170 [Pirellulaceae bacterium]|nr:hypothetical protein [Pirellulaceae bacterium]
MWRKTSRRIFLQSAVAAGVSLRAGPWDALLPISPASADEAAVASELVRFTPDIEPIVRLIEETPRAKCAEMMIEQLRAGLPYRCFLAALYLANIRTGMVDHPLAVLHSAGQLALDLPVQERLLPIFWALDSFKVHQGDGKNPLYAAKLKPLAGKLPPADKAEEELHAAMSAGDGERAERAIVALVRSQGAARIAEALWHYGARDWFFIGHQAIWAANCWRPLETVGWQYAEPILRVVVTNLLGSEQDRQLQPYEANRQHVARTIEKLPPDWAQGDSDPGFVKELLALWRESSDAPRSESPRRGEFPGGVDSRMTPHAAKKRDVACELVAAALVEGKVKAGAVWDAVHLAAGEMMMCSHKGPEPGHSYTASNALHYAFAASGDPANRLLALLQAVGWLFHFRENMADKDWLREPRQITELAGAKISDKPEDAAAEILAHLSFGAGGTPAADPTPGFRGIEHNNLPWRHEAASKAFAFAEKFKAPEPLVRAAWRLLPLKADWDPHRIKFPIAAWENCGWVSATWRPHLVAAASYVFLGADALDTDLTRQIRQTVEQL